MRSGADGGREHQIPANFTNVRATDLCTTVGVTGATVATIEHLMAALCALDIDNVMVEIDGPEVPVMDGSAGAFIDAIDEAGVARLDAPRRYIKVLKPDAGRLRPVGSRVPALMMACAWRSRSISPTPLVGRQSFAADIDGDVFRREIARARTFGFLADIEKLWARGFALGASLENAVVFGDDRVINPEGLRFADEFVRHKALDAIGDLALAGAPILGCYRSFRGGHRLNVMALEALIDDESAWTHGGDAAYRRESGHADLPARGRGRPHGPTHFLIGLKTKPGRLWMAWRGARLRHKNAPMRCHRSWRRGRVWVKQAARILIREARRGIGRAGPG